MQLSAHNAGQDFGHVYTSLEYLPLDLEFQYRRTNIITGDSEICRRTVRDCIRTTDYQNPVSFDLLLTKWNASSPALWRYDLIEDQP